MTDDETQDENLLEDAEYSKKTDFSKASLVEQAIAKIRDIRSKEMKPGYFNIMYLPDGSCRKQYIPDTRKEFCASVDYLLSILAHERGTDERIKGKMSKFNECKENLFKKYSVNVRRPNNSGGVEILKEKYLPEVDDSILIQGVCNRVGKSSLKEFRSVVGYYNYKVKSYWDDMLINYDFIFAELNILIANKNYFKTKTSY